LLLVMGLGRRLAAWNGGCITGFPVGRNRHFGAVAQPVAPVNDDAFARPKT